MPHGRRHIGDDDGFTIVEVLVAALVVAVGLLGAFLMLTVTLRASQDTRARAGPVTLAREITEDARAIPYSQLSGSTIVSQLQAMPGLSNSSSGPTWTILRTGTTNASGVLYTVTAGVTNVTDPKDLSNGVDFKQVAITVSWKTFQNKTHSITEIETMTKAGEDPGLAVSGLVLSSPAQGTTGVSGGASTPIISSGSVSQLQFSVTAAPGTTAIVWTLNGTRQPSWGGVQAGTTWTSLPWAIPTTGASQVSDGTYTIGAQAEDANGVDGPAVKIPVRLIRSVPSAPAVTGAGFNANFNGNSTAAEFQWNANPELNVIGYQITNPSGVVICQTSTTASYPASCSKNTGNAWCSAVNACVDLSPPSVTASNLTYQIAALYNNASNVPTAGTATSVALASGVPTSPAAPPSVTVTPQPDGSAILTWTTPTDEGSNSSATVSFYRIYRDGHAYTNRFDTVTCSSSCSYHDTSRVEPHSYYVTSVGGGSTLGADMAESAPTGPVTG